MDEIMKWSSEHLWLYKASLGEVMVGLPAASKLSMCLYHLAAWGYWALSGQAPFNASKADTSAWLGTNLEENHVNLELY